METIKICIIETGRTKQELINKHGDFPHMIEEWLRPVLNNAQFITVRASEGEPVKNAAQKFDAFIITGSPHGVYENLPWMSKLKTELQEIAKEKKPIFGICFGHQILAESFGGKVEKSTKGWGIGVDSYMFYKEGKGQGINQLMPVYVYHQDQIVELPPKAQVLGGSSHCEYGIVQYDFPCLSVQFHPEFTSNFVSDLINTSEEQKENKEKLLNIVKEASVDNLIFAQWVRDFIKKNINKKAT